MDENPLIEYLPVVFIVICLPLIEFPFLQNYLNKALNLILKMLKLVLVAIIRKLSFSSFPTPLSLTEKAFCDMKN